MKFFYLFLGIFFPFLSRAWSLREEMYPNNDTIGVDEEWTFALNEVFIYIKDFIFILLWVIAVGTFLYFWFRLIISRWNEEEFSKALMGFVYAIVGLSIIPLALWVVKIVSSLDF